MKYRTLRSLFHESEEKARALHGQRLRGECSFRLGFDVAGHPAFCVMTPELTLLCLRAAKADKRIARLSASLPSNVLAKYLDACLIDDVVTTNSIEAVHSTHKEIQETLSSVRGNGKKRNRFQGIVKSYQLLLEGHAFLPETCADIRQLYDALVASEVCEHDESDAPDGKLFRKGPVSVCDGMGKAVHQGVEPESKIIEMLTVGLHFLKEDDIPTLVRAALFHFLFAYVHPFYDGNGRMNRFISSCLLAEEYELAVALRLSRFIQDDLRAYYKAFSTCEHKLNRGDLTPFAIAFAQIIVNGMEQLAADLEESLRALSEEATTLEGMPGLAEDEGLLACAKELSAAGLFALQGVTSKELAEELGISDPTLYKRLGLLREMGLLGQEKTGRQTFYHLISM